MRQENQSSLQGLLKSINAIIIIHSSAKVCNFLDNSHGNNFRPPSETTESIISEPTEEPSTNIQPRPTNTVTDTPYENPDYKIRILYPANWKVNQNELPAHAIVMFEAPISGDTILPASLLVANYQLSNDNSSLEQFIDFFFKDRYTSPSDYKIINTENTTLDGLMAKRFNMYDYNKNPVTGLSSTSKVMRVLAVDNNSNGYAIKYESVPGLFDNYLITAQKMINSLELNQNISHVTKQIANNYFSYSDFHYHSLPLLEFSL